MEHILKDKNILVTGATGLVGGHLVEKLISLGANVVITYRSHNPKSYFAARGLDKKVISAICDINDHKRVIEVVNRYEVEYIFHIAAQAIVGAAFLDPRQALETNIMGTINVFEAARLSPKVKGIIFASSDKAYGKNCLDATETQSLAGDHPYDVSKSAADLIAATYYKTYGLPIAVSRFGNIFGPGDMNFNRIIPGIMDSILNQKTLEIRSDGSFRRDYVYVKDVVDGYITLLENINKIKGEAFNFSSGHNFSVLELIEKAGKILDKKVDYKISNTQKNEIPSQSLNFEKAGKILNWKPGYSLEEGIKETYSWYKDYFNS